MISAAKGFPDNALEVVRALAYLLQDTRIMLVQARGYRATPALDLGGSDEFEDDERRTLPRSLVYVS